MRTTRASSRKSATSNLNGSNIFNSGLSLKTLTDSLHFDEDTAGKIIITAQQVLSEIPQIAQMVSDVSANIVSSLKDSTGSFFTVVSSTLKTLDKSVKRNPWKFVAISGATAFAAGYMVGHRRLVPISAGRTSHADRKAIH